MKKTLFILLVLVLGLALIGCSSNTSIQQTAIDLPEYIVVDDNDVSIPGTTRLTYWVAVEEQIDESVAEAIAKAVSADDRDIDEVTVWIYDSVDAAKNGMITNKMYDVVLSKGKVTDTVKNELYCFE